MRSEKEIELLKILCSRLARQVTYRPDKVLGKLREALSEIGCI